MGKKILVVFVLLFTLGLVESVEAVETVASFGSIGSSGFGGHRGTLEFGDPYTAMSGTDSLVGTFPSVSGAFLFDSTTFFVNNPPSGSISGSTQTGPLLGITNCATIIANTVIIYAGQGVPVLTESKFAAGFVSSTGFSCFCVFPGI